MFLRRHICLFEALRLCWVSDRSMFLQADNMSSSGDESKLVSSPWCEVISCLTNCFCPEEPTNIRSDKAALETHDCRTFSRKPAAACGLCSRFTSQDAAKIHKHVLPREAQSHWFIELLLPSNELHSNAGKHISCEANSIKATLQCYFKIIEKACYSYTYFKDHFSLLTSMHITSILAVY